MSTALATPDPTAASLTEAIQAAVLNLPDKQLAGLAAALEAHDRPSGAARRAACSVVANSRFRQHAVAILTAWAADAHACTGASVALALRTAHGTAAHLRSLVDVDIAWTGPASYPVPVRRTREVLLEVIDSARESLILVSFAAYKVPDVLSHLKSAAHRGVEISLVLETKEDSAGALSFDAAHAFTELRDTARFYVWPADLRPEQPNGATVSMHAKAALADDHTAFVTSANLTGLAQTENMELGVVVRGGPVPQRLTQHFRVLISNEVLRRVEGSAPHA